MRPSLVASPSALAIALLLAGSGLGSFACGDENEAPNAGVLNTVAPNAAAPNAAMPRSSAPNAATPNVVAPNAAMPSAATPNMAVPNVGVEGAPAPVAVAPAAGEVGQRRLSAIGLQLYTVRAELERDFEGTLRSVADMGYREVELAGLFGHDPAQVRQLLADLGLEAVGSHVDWTRLRDDPEGAIEETLALGAEYLVFPWLPDTERATLEQWRGWVVRLNALGAASKERGVAVAYHNHDFEFTPIDGVQPYDILLEERDPSLVRFELDLYWLAKAGGEPSALFERAPQAFPLVHLKDLRGSDQAIVDVGQGDLDFAEVFAQAAAGGLQHFIVEHDSSTDPLQTAENSIRYLQQLTY
jgi:sugar phosphate isomerase/epimerase